MRTIRTLRRRYPSAPAPPPARPVANRDDLTPAEVSEWLLSLADEGERAYRMAQGWSLT